MSEMQDWNANVIEEFRANEGRVGGQFEGAPMLLLHTTGSRYPGFAEYQERTWRVIPVVDLRRAGAQL